jgi:hypothetical protein
VLEVVKLIATKVWFLRQLEGSGGWALRDVPHGDCGAQRGSFTVETAAGLYLAERQAEARCLMRLLATAWAVVGDGRWVGWYGPQGSEAPL